MNMIQKIPIKIKKSPNERQKIIFKNLVEDYIEKGGPVSSTRISQKIQLNVSPATIRIELSNLEDYGLVYHPHTSAGCIPSDKGLRYYVDYIMGDEELSSAEEKELIKELEYLGNQYNKLIKQSINSLSDISSYTALGVLPNSEVYYARIANLLCKHNLPEEDILKILEIIDKFEDYIDYLMQEPGSYRFYIGEENPIEGMNYYSMIVAGYKLQNWGNGIISLIGPKKMAYSKVKSLVKYLSDFISER